MSVTVKEIDDDATAYRRQQTTARVLVLDVLTWNPETSEWVKIPSSLRDWNLGQAVFTAP